MFAVLLIEVNVFFIQIATHKKDSSPIHLQIVTTHLQASYDFDSGKNIQKQVAAKHSQLKQLRQFLQTQHANHPGVPILIQGDLNVNGRSSPWDGTTHSQGYLSMIKSLDVSNSKWGETLVDLQYTNLNEHPITTSDVNPKPRKGDTLKVLMSNIDYQNKQGRYRETVLTNKKDWGNPKCLDYMLFISKQSTANTTPQTNPPSQITPKLSSAKVNPFFVKNKPYTQLSDHYGVSCTFDIPGDVI